LPISTFTVTTGDIGVYVDALGTVTPLNTVSLTARVAGQIAKVQYQEGQIVHVGDPLVEIDPAPFEAAVTQAEGQLARDQAQLELAKINLQRDSDLLNKGVIAKQEFDTQTANDHQFEGTVKLDQGNLDGIVKKNAILMVDFALDAERNQGLSPEESIYQACLIRFRPIMMTTMAALFGALPLAIGMGIGSELRRPLGIAIVGGLIVSQMLTLYTTPVVYLVLDQLRQRWAVRRRRAKNLPAPGLAGVPAFRGLAR
jgi:hypothetical protein